MTFYLKYRPQTIGELDLEKVRTQLKQALTARSVPHAFLFSGSRGLGKTSSARIVAKALTCLTPKDKRIDGIEPCNTCDACVTITKGSSPDVIEIDGASNRGIDDIRALRDTVALAPMQLKLKVYIIDEVHMLTKEAFNALLKTLEEPPTHAVFILGTTEPHKVPETILSRSFHIQFQRASEVELLRALSRVTKGEGIEVEELVLRSLIRRAHGGFRDSVKMLEQLAFTTSTIGMKEYEQMFGHDEPELFIECLVKRDGSGALAWIQKQEAQGQDFTNIIRNILTVLRDELRALLENKPNARYKISREEVTEMITLCMQAAQDQKVTLIETLPLELLVAKWVSEASSTLKDPSFVPLSVSASRRIADPASQGRQNSQQEEQEISADNHVPPTVNQPEESEPQSIRTSGKKKSDAEISDTNTSDSPTLRQSESSEFSENVPAKQKKPEVRNEADIEVNQNANITLDEIKSKWEALLQAIRPKNRSLESLLRGSTLSQADGDILTITVYYGLHKQQLESDKYLRMLESSFKDTFGYKPRLVYVLGDKGEKQVIEAGKDQELEKNVEEIFS